MASVREGRLRMERVKRSGVAVKVVMAGMRKDSSRQDSHAEVHAGCQGSGEHEPGCISHWHISRCLCHLFKEGSVLDGEPRGKPEGGSEVRRTREG